MNSPIQNYSILIVGMGSIGTRHCFILDEMGCNVSSVSRRGDGDYNSIKKALIDNHYEIVVIATETVQHLPDLVELKSNGFNGLIMIEKPIGVDINDCLPIKQTPNTWVAYNMRFNPVIEALLEHLKKNRQVVLTAQLYVGQHLSQWRPNRNKDDVYSSTANLGGGVLRDLSHELDLALWMFGPVKNLNAIGGQISNLTVDSDDCWSIIAQHEKCNQLTISLNYFDRPARRFIHINTNEESITADLIENSLVINGEKSLIKASANSSYISMWKAVFKELQGSDSGSLCSFEEGLDVMRYINACEVDNHK